MSKRVGIVGRGGHAVQAKWQEKTYSSWTRWLPQRRWPMRSWSPAKCNAAFTLSTIDIFQRTCIPDTPSRGSSGLQNKFGLRVSKLRGNGA